MWAFWLFHVDMVFISRGWKTSGPYRSGQEIDQLTASPFLKGTTADASLAGDLFLLHIKSHTLMHKKQSLLAKIDFINTFSL